MGFFKILKFRFNAPLHIGTVKTSLDASEKMLHSDTLYAAIVQAWVRLGLDFSEQIGPNGQPLDFALGSLFPYYDLGQRTILFFPALKHQMEIAPGEKVDSKDLDQVLFVDYDLFRELQQQGKMIIRKPDIQGEFCSRTPLGQSKHQKLIASQVYPRVRVARSGVSGSNEPYYIERIVFQEGAGLYALAWFDSDTAFRNVCIALHYLGDEGLGTDRHVGNGLFKLEIPEFTPDELFPVSADYRMNLSLFLPASAKELSAMIDSEQAVFDTIERGGWITTDAFLSYKKNSIHMFREGSVFRFNGLIEGATENLRPTRTPRDVDAPVWRTGRSIFVPIKL